MNYEKLLEPYKENGRTAEGQVTWLLKKGLSKASIDQAMIEIYDGVERGQKYLTGHELDRALFDRASALAKADVIASLGQLEIFHQSLRDKWGDDLMKIAEAARNAVKPVGFFTRFKRALIG